MKALAELDGDVFLPNPEPRDPVDYVFVCMEPSLGGQTPRQVEESVAAGARNFVNSTEDFLLHFSVRRFLIKPGQSYHITDVSKGAMLVELAGEARSARYARWCGLLEAELELVAKEEARLFAVGRAVSDFFRLQALSRSFSTILHYSGQAAAARAACIEGHEADFEAFKHSVAMSDLLAVAEDVLVDSVGDDIRGATLERLAMTDLTESRKKLIYCYKLAFEEMRV